MTTTDRRESGEKPILQVSSSGILISRRAIMFIAALAGVPGGVAIWSAHDVGLKTDDTAEVAATAAKDVGVTFELYRREQLDDRAEAAKTRDLVNQLVDEVKVLRAAVAASIPRERSRWRTQGRPAPEKLPIEPKAPLPPSPAAAAATVPPAGTEAPR